METQKFITILRANRPILIYAIHNCINWNEWGTKEISEQLHEREGFYSFIYSGFKQRCLIDTKLPSYILIDEMLKEYEKIGLISLHRRSPKSKIDPSPRNFFELGTLKDQSLDIVIKEQFNKLMHKKNILYDDNVRFIGGSSIWRFHKKHNDPSYKHGQISQHNPSRNLIQMAQLEINGLKRPDINIHYECVSDLAHCIEAYLS